MQGKRALDGLNQFDLLRPHQDPLNHPVSHLLSVGRFSAEAGLDLDRALRNINLRCEWTYDKSTKYWNPTKTLNRG